MTQRNLIIISCSLYRKTINKSIYWMIHILKRFSFDQTTTLMMVLGGLNYETHYVSSASYGNRTCIIEVNIAASKWLFLS